MLSMPAPLSSAAPGRGRYLLRGSDAVSRENSSRPRSPKAFGTVQPAEHVLLRLVELGELRVQTVVDGAGAGPGCEGSVDRHLAAHVGAIEVTERHPGKQRRAAQARVERRRDALDRAVHHVRVD